MPRSLRKFGQSAQFVISNIYYVVFSDGELSHPHRTLLAYLHTQRLRSNLVRAGQLIIQEEFAVLSSYCVQLDPDTCISDIAGLGVQEPHSPAVIACPTKTSKGFLIPGACSLGQAMACSVKHHTQLRTYTLQHWLPHIRGMIVLQITY